MSKAEDKQDLCDNDAEAGATGSSTMQPSSSSYPRQQPPMLSQAPPQYQQQPATTNGLPIPSLGAPGGVGAPPPPLPPQQQQRVLPYDTNQVTVVPYIPSSSSSRQRPKSLSLAIVLCVSVLGIFGAHHFYLNRPVMGILYINTLGMFGIGWIIDWFRICSLVSNRNEEVAEVKERGYWLTAEKYGRLNKRSLVDAYLMWFPPIGWCGIHHFYVGRARYGMFCACTCGLNLIGWLVDFFRMPYLVRRANQDIEKMRRGETVKEDKSPFNLLDAYLLAFPLGLFGVHHFYLGNTRRGVLYLCTLGVFGLGWLADLFQMPLLVSEANRNRQFKERLFSVLDNQPAQRCPTTMTVDGTNVIVVPSSGAAPAPGYHGNQYQHPPQYQDPMSDPPPAYMPHASAGEIVESSYQQQSVQYPSS